MGASARGRGLARHLSGHFARWRGIRLGNPTCYNYKELHKAVTCEKSGENEKAKALWTLKEAKDKGIGFHDLGSAQKTQTRFQVRLDLWAIHEEPAGCSGRRTETCSWPAPVISNERCILSRVTREFFSWWSDCGCASHLTAFWAARVGKRSAEATCVLAVLVPTFRVARLTSQTRKLWLVGVATDPNARHACLRFFSLYFSCFFFLLAFLFIVFFPVFFFFCQHKKSKTSKKINKNKSRKKQKMKKKNKQKYFFKKKHHFPKNKNKKSKHTKKIKSKKKIKEKKRKKRPRRKCYKKSCSK